MLLNELILLGLSGRGRPLPRVRIQDDGLLLRPLFGRSSFVPWTKIKGVRTAPADRWSGPNASRGQDGYYMIQVKLAGEWRRVGEIRRVEHTILPPSVRENLFGPRHALPAREVGLLTGYELIRYRWVAAGGKPGEEDDNWPPL
ncbi:PH domain-containing protein [Actinoplanes sp. KI2]|uniref:PH domain-containing protein n=1 Tax=Actinoplanes sp. KI2 TaxID=2983315 RepID=UPI0021D56F35|nr:PH domain-containing protein [Actinoplanes sp. KI2]MCU7725204.1 PH domain-containing protein [Actinoplanes sp. KI2]